MKITIREVAEKANVSIGTASRVLSGNSGVKPENVASVERAVKALGYKPLRNRSQKPVPGPLKGRIVGLILLGMDRSLETLPVVAKAIHGVEAALTKTGSTLLLADLPTLEEKAPILDNDHLDGIILKGALQGNAIIAKQAQCIERLRQLPSVWILGRPEGCWGDVVNANNHQAGRIAAEHLMRKGHRHLAFINPKADHVTFTARESSFVWHAENAGASVLRLTGSLLERWTLPLKPVKDHECVDSLVDELLAATPKVTAVFTPADSIAALVHRSLASRGMTVGKDISLISCNHEEALINSLYPKLTTIDIHADQIGSMAVDQLIWRIANQEIGPVDRSMGVDLVEGDSVADV